MRLWRVHIKTYYFGIRYYDLFVLANTESNMLRTVYDYVVGWVVRDYCSECATKHNIEL